MKTPFRLFVLNLFAGLFFLSIPGAGTATGFQATAPAPAGATPHKQSTVKAAPSAQDVSDARSKGMVWANLSTHVYHKDGSSMYGTTKRGKFMTEEDAKKAGFRAANETGSRKKHSAAATGTGR